MTSFRFASDEPRATTIHVAVLPILFAVVVLARWMLISTFGTDVPYWDQWDSEISLLYKPFVDGTLPWSRFLEPHNEHRIAFSRLYNLVLFVLNGKQFDNLVEAYANTLVYVCGLLMFARPVLWRLAGTDFVLGALAVLIAGVLPFAVDNLLFGFQNAFYFMNLLAVAGVLAIAFGERRAAVAAALVLALASIFTIASGLLLAPVILAVTLLRWHAGQFTRASAATTAAIALAIAGLGLWLLPSVPYHQSFRPQTPAAFIDAALTTLSWPLSGHPLAALALWWPGAVVLWRILRKPGETRTIDLFLLGIAGWVFLQALAIAYSRGVGMTAVTGRYLDTLMFGPLANLALAVRLLNGTGSVAGQRLAAGAVGATAVLCGAGFIAVTLRWAPSLFAFAKDFKTNRTVMRAFLDGQGAQAFAGKTGPEISYMTADSVIARISDPTIRGLLPPSLRQPLVVPVDGACTAFEPYGAYPLTPPATGALGSYRAGVGNPSVGTCRSLPFRSDQPYLSFRMAGYPAPFRPGMAFSLQREDGTVVLVAPSREPHETWYSVAVANPGGNLRWVATDENPEFWFAFTAPAETGALSAARLWLVERLDIAPPGMFW